MSPLALVGKRARAGLGLVLTVLALTAVTTATIAGTLGYSQAAATVAARQALTGAAPTEAGIRVQTRLADDTAAQDAAAREIIAEVFAPAPVRVQQMLVSEPRPVQGRPERLVAIAGAALRPDDPGFTRLVDVVEGSWPTGPDSGQAVPGALHAGAGERWGVAVGDTLTVAGVQVRVDALWRPVDNRAALWFGDPLVTGGSDGTQVGPLVVDPAAIGAFGGDRPFSRWTVQPEADAVQPQDMPVLAAAARGLKSAMATPEVDLGRGARVEGDLAPTAAAAARNLATARALNIVPLVLLLLVSVIAVVQLARLQAQARSGEVELLMARGAQRHQVLGWTVLEATAVTAAATVLGVAGALLVMGLVPAGDQQTATVAQAGTLTGLGVLAALGAVALWQARALSSAGTVADRSGRMRQAAALGTLVLTLGAAGLTWWQLRRYGSPLVTADDGSLRTDLLAGAAPALLLAAVAVIASALLGPAGRIAEALTGPVRRLTAHLAASQVSRRLAVYAVPVVLTVLAVGAATLAGLYAATSAGLRGDLSDLAQGADVRVTLTGNPGSGAADLLEAGLVDGVQGWAPVWQVDTRAGPTQALLTVLPADRLSEAAIVPRSAMDPAVAAERLSPGARGDQGRDVSEGSIESAAPDGARTVVPVAVTTSLATANNLEVGSALDLQAWGGPVSGEIALIVEAIPGTLSPEVVLADSRTLTAALASGDRSLPAPSELWVSSTDPRATVEQLQGVDGVESVAGPGTGVVIDAAASVRLVFWVAAAGAMLLAVTGIGAVGATLVAGRRPEVAVLRALGMSPGAQARSRAGELLGVVTVSVLLGLGGGWLVAAMVVPELARSTTLAGQVVLRAPLRLELPLWLGLLGALLLALVLLVTVLAWRVRAQAMDAEYREEIR